jgi:hypothetical protein
VKAFDVYPPLLGAERRVIHKAVIMDRKMDAAFFEMRHETIVPSEHIRLQGIADLLRCGRPAIHGGKEGTVPRLGEEKWLSSREDDRVVPPPGKQQQGGQACGKPDWIMDIRKGMRGTGNLFGILVTIRASQVACRKRAHGNAGKVGEEARLHSICVFHL